jgi:RNA polymerase sigma factor (sigma-70 family)
MQLSRIIHTVGAASSALRMGEMAYSSKPPLTESTSDGPMSGGGDLHALALQYGPALRRYFARRASAADVDDLVQEVFLSMQSRGATSEIENVEGYLFRTAANVLGQRRRSASWSWGRQEEVDDATGPTDELSPERILIGKEEFDALVAALQELPPRSALAFMLFRVERLPQEDIARRMGISARAVRALVNRAHKRIYELVGWRL